MIIDSFLVWMEGDREVCRQETIQRKLKETLWALDFQQWRRGRGKVVGNWGKFYSHDIPSSLVYLEMETSGKKTPLVHTKPIF